jgi:hypothetical protein
LGTNVSNGKFCLSQVWECDKIHRSCDFWQPQKACALVGDRGVGFGGGDGASEKMAECHGMVLRGINVLRYLARQWDVKVEGWKRERENKGE